MYVIKLIIIGDNYDLFLKENVFQNYFVEGIKI